jgi:dCTP deaminase
MHKMDLSDGAVLETGCVYVIPLQERLSLPQKISATANAKSSTGRLDVFTRLITDYGTEFDRVVSEYEWQLYAEISPRTFSILVHAGDCLNQIRFHKNRSQAQLTDDELRQVHKHDKLIDDDTVQFEEGISFSIDLKSSDCVGYKARQFSDLIDLSKIDTYDVKDFWQPIYKQDSGQLILDPDAFYILVSREAVHIPPYLAAEMTPYLSMMGEFRVHYAGFFDPGFGYASEGGEGSRGVLEVRCHEVPFVLEHGQVVGRLVYERMLEQPQKLYGKSIGSNYQAQALKLSKHFKAA